MARHPTDTDKKLLNHGRKLLLIKGASQLSIREVCAQAQVNLGMFNYHFGSKDKFIEQLLTEIYAEFLANFKLVTSDTNIETLELQLTMLARFARDNRHLILILLKDILNGEKVVQKFARQKMRKHFIMLAKTIKSCQQSKEIINTPLPILITHIAASIGLSNLIPEVLSYLNINKVFNLGLIAITKNLMTDEALALRVKMTILGIKNHQ